MSNPTPTDAPMSAAPLSWTMADIDAVARTIWGEARGEPQDGQIAVAWVIRNRAEAALRHRARCGEDHPLFGDGDPASACRTPWQFSCWNAGDPNRAKIEGVALSDRAYCRALAIALQVACGDFGDPVGGATHYHSHLVDPRWARGKRPVALIGNHFFYNDID